MVNPINVYSEAEKSQDGFLSSSYSGRNADLFIQNFNAANRALITREGKAFFAKYCTASDISRPRSVVHAAVLLDADWNFLWEVSLPASFWPGISFSICETNGGNLALCGTNYKTKNHELLVFSLDGKIIIHETLDSDMLNPIVTAKGLVFMRIDPSGGTRSIAIRDWAGNMQTTALNGISDYAALVVNIINNNTYLFGISDAVTGQPSETLIRFNKDWDITFTYTSKQERMIPVWQEFSNGDVVVFTMSEDTKHSYLKRISSQGNLIWSKELIGNAKHLTAKLMLNEDQENIMLFGIGRFQTANEPAFFSLSFDQNGNAFDSFISVDSGVVLYDPHKSGILFSKKMLKV